MHKSLNPLKLGFLSILTFTLPWLSLAQELFVESPIEVASGYGFHHPQLEISNDELPLVTWTDPTAQAIYFARHNGVDGFNTPLMLNPPGLAIQSYSWSGPDLTIDGDNVYVIFRSADYEEGHIYLVKSTDNGLSFGDTVRIDNLVEGFGQYPDIAVYQDTIFGTFMLHNEIGIDPQYVFVRSTDGGSTFEPIVTAGELLGAEACDCCPPEIIVNEDKVIIFFRRNNDNLREIKAVVSYDRGASFSDWYSVDDHGWFLMSCPSTGPDARFLDDDITLSIYKTEFDDANRIFFNSYNTVSAESDLQEIYADGFENTNNNYPQLAIQDEEIGIVWESVQPGTSSDVFFNNTTAVDLDFNPENTINITNTIGVQAKPDKAISDGIFHLVYANSHTLSVDYLRIGATLEINENDNINPLSIQYDKSKMILTVFTEEIESERISIHNLNGQLIKTIPVINADQTYIITNDLPEGMYFVSITFNGKVYTEKFVK
ncbi:T9SS type A sorting domain-containing protein [Crocinitomix catalasitica]|uniref:T9SS type A sorting domain-containing protein n=1 Tax=Crocinitomix catalasitica TaxID=184607 RepID=UPI00146FC109|nr:T9SS type A sorting domain-containing protein [Crocinitomix catalasitica]